MQDEYKGVKVGFEIELGNARLSQLTIVTIMLEHVRSMYPKEYAAATKAIEEAGE